MTVVRRLALAVGLSILSSSSFTCFGSSDVFALGLERPNKNAMLASVE